MAPTGSSRSNTPHSKSSQNSQKTTPHAKHRLNFTSSLSHPVEVIGRIRDNPNPDSVLSINTNRRSIRVKTDIGYRDFTLDGVSSSSDEDLDGFYEKFVENRINGVKLGEKCTVMMYGPTGSGKSYTMFGCGKQPGIVYRSLRGILGEDDEASVGNFVHVTVLEIYNEELYDLLATSGGGGFGFGWPKGNSSKVRLEVMGKKAKNATFISGTEAGKISKEIQKVEKRRIIKSTLCNERSSRSHCMIILDVPTVGGRLMLVDMAGSENIEQAGQTGFEAKMQTCKINQGNIALKRVVESIANGDSHVPFRDSKLTMLLQDSFEDDKSKILMILCASPDSKEMHKTISTLEYGAKAKCIVRGPPTPVKDKHENEESFVAMNQFVLKLQMENKRKEKERIEAQRELMKKDEEVSTLRAKLAQAEGKEPGMTEEEINKKVNEQTKSLKQELEMKILESEKMAKEFVELEKRRMEEKILQQQQEVEMLRRRLEETELELRRSRERSGEDFRVNEINANGFASRLVEMYADEDPGMVKSMDLSRSMDFDKPTDVNIVDNSCNIDYMNEDGNEAFASNFSTRVPLSTVFEEEEEEEEDEEEEDKEESGDDEVQKEVIEEKTIYSASSEDLNVPNLDNKIEYIGWESRGEPRTSKDSVFNRKARIENIFTLCGNYRETPGTTVRGEISNLDIVPVNSKENNDPLSQVVISNDEVEVYVQWDASKEQPGKFIANLKVAKNATLADLRKFIEIHLGADKQGFTFLVHGNQTEAPISKEKEATMPACKLPICNQKKGHIACLRPLVKGNEVHLNQLPFVPLQNIHNVTAAW